jgi:hypothetical protein
MYEALQHFEPEDLKSLLRNLKTILQPHAPVLFGSVPDQQRLLSFYNTPERRAEYQRRVSDGTEAMGTWWDKNQIRAIAADEGFQAEILPQPVQLHTAHYRFDVFCRRGR